jgi:hypothetical protein
MVYKGVCARLNGTPDSSGDILGENFEIPRNPVNVTHNFYEKTCIGTAWIEVEGNEVIAYVNLFDSEVFPKEHVEQMYAVIGGSISDRDGASIKKWTLKDVALTATPCDKTLTRLKWNKRDSCCEYKGPPFRACHYCGGRETI